MHACNFGHHECAQALIVAGSAVDRVDYDGRTALMWACGSGHHECAQALIGARANLEVTSRDGLHALMIACASPHPRLPPSAGQGKARCALALLAATAPIREADFADWAALLKFAGERLQRIEIVLASTHVIEDAPLLARVKARKTDAQDIFAHFARDMLARPREADFPDRAASLDVAGDRLQ